jgi:HAD superfamily hydrolase (TIGR01509 family)
MLKAVLFDMDGVLVDTEHYSTMASEEVLARHGIIQTPEEKKNVFGRRTLDNYRDAVNARGLSIDPQQLVKEKNRRFAEIIAGKVKPMEGVSELLGQLDKAGVSKAVVSSSPLDRVNVTLMESGLFEHFKTIISGDCCKLGKPNPEPFLLAAQTLNAKPGECLVIEDAQAGIEAGKDAGMKVLAVKSPNTHGQDLTKSDLIVDSLRDVNLKILENML